MGRAMFEWRMLPWLDENGDIPEGALTEALQARDEYLQSGLDSDGFGEIPASHLTWVSRGPDNVGGRTRQMIVHPTDSDILWAASAGGGVWKSFDRGDHWLPMNGNLQNYIVSSLTLDTNPPPQGPPTYQTMYAGTGELGYNGGGIFKSTDEGTTWTLLGSTDPRLAGNSHWASVNRISIKPGDSQVLLASNNSGVWRSTNGGVNWSPEPTALDSGSRYVSFDPNDGTKAVAEVVEMVGLDPVPTAKYMYLNQGQPTWATAQRRIGPAGAYVPFALPDGHRIEFAFKPNESNVVYALNRFSGNPAKAEVSRSTDGGHHFTRMRTNLPPGEENGIGVSAWAAAVWASPTDPMTVVVGGMGHLFRSTDGGDNFVRISDGNIFVGEQPHVDQHCLVSDPQQLERVYSCNDGGVYRAENIYNASTTSGWENKSRTYRTSQYNAGVGGILNPGGGQLPINVIYGGTQDNGTMRSTVADQDAISTIGGDGGFAAIDADASHCYGSLPGLLVYRGNCGVNHLTYPIFRGIGAHPWFGVEGTNALIDALHGGSNPVAPFVIDPNDPNRIIAGGLSLWRTNNARETRWETHGPAWFCIRGPAGGPCPVPNPSGSPTPTPPGAFPVSAIAVAPGYSNIIWVAYNNWTVFKTTNGLDATPTWTQITPSPGPSPEPLNAFITRIVIDPNDPDIVYVAKGAVANNLIKTVNGGGTWTDITGPLPVNGGLPDNIPIRGIARHPNDPDRLYAGTEIGLFSTENGGATWQTELAGPANVSVSEVTFIRGSTTLLAATYGRGAWTAETEPAPAPNFIPFDFDADGRSDVGIFRPSDGTWRVRRSRDGFLETQFGADGDAVAAEDYDGDQKADLTVFRATEGAWYRLNSSDGSFHASYFGINGDIVVPADYDGDDLADEAVFRPSDQNWYIDLSTTGFTTVNWGLEDDLPVAADFDGDDHADVGVFRLKDGVWYLLTTGNGYEYYQFGMDGDMPVAADYDGDARADVAVWRPSNGDWWFLNSSGGITARHFGQEGDIPVPADYDGDGLSDIAVWRPTNGNWYLLNSRSGVYVFEFGAQGDVPVPSYVLNRDAARIAPIGPNASVPKIDAPTTEWFATGIPQERFARKTFKPGSIPGISDSNKIRKLLGQPPRRGN